MSSKWFPESQYKEALHHAITVARAVGHDTGLEKFAEYGKPGFRSGFLLPKPENCSGFELRCERIKSGDPLP